LTYALLRTPRTLADRRKIAIRVQINPGEKKEKTLCFQGRATFMQLLH
jgi:hypothetical protein